MGIEVDVNGTIFTATQQGNRDNGNFVVTSWDSCGNRIWQSLSPGGVTYSESSIQGSTTDHIDLDSCGNVYVVGPSTGSRDPVRDEAFVKKYSFTGDLIWADFFDPPGEHPGLLGYTHAGGIAVSPDGSIYVVGYGFERSGGTQTLGWVRKYRPNGSSEWTQTVALNDDSVEFKAVAADDTGAFITGRSRQKIYLAKFSPGGTVVWSFNDALTPATSDFLTTGYDVEIGPDGMLNLAVGQSTYAFTTVGVAKFDTSGNLTGTATYAGHERAISSNHASRGIAVASDGGVYIAGYQAPGSLGIKKFNNDLDLSWERFVTHAGSTAATCGLNAMAINLALDSRGFAYSIGHYVGTTSGIMSGPTSEIPCTSRDHYTVILDKIGPNGENSGWPETPPLSP